MYLGFHVVHVRSFGGSKLRIGIQRLDKSERPGESSFFFCI